MRGKERIYTALMQARGGERREDSATIRTGLDSSFGLEMGYQKSIKGVSSPQFTVKRARTTTET